MRRRNAFTLTELLVVLACIAVLISLVLPVAAKARSVSRTTTCLNNLRAIGGTFSAYMLDNSSALIPYNFNTPQAYNGYWFGILDHQGLRGDAIKCPAAYEPSLDSKRRGFGTAQIGWTGQYASPIGSAIHFSKTVWRDGSYGFNRYLNAKNGMGPKGVATSLLYIKEPLSDVPAFMDCAYADVAPPPAPPTGIVVMPPDLTGKYAFPNADPTVKYGGEHWSLLIARHDKAINIAMADGSARTVPLTDLYQLSWRSNWQKVELTLP